MNPLQLFEKARQHGLDDQERAWLEEQLRQYPYFSLLRLVAAHGASAPLQRQADAYRRQAAAGMSAPAPDVRQAPAPAPPPAAAAPPEPASPPTPEAPAPPAQAAPPAAATANYNPAAAGGINPNFVRPKPLDTAPDAAHELTPHAAEEPAHDPADNPTPEPAAVAPPPAQDAPAATEPPAPLAAHEPAARSAPPAAGQIHWQLQTFLQLRVGMYLPLVQDLADQIRNYATAAQHQVAPAAGTSDAPAAAPAAAPPVPAPQPAAPEAAAPPPQPQAAQPETTEAEAQLPPELRRQFGSDPNMDTLRQSLLDLIQSQIKGEPSAPTSGLNTESIQPLLEAPVVPSTPAEPTADASASDAEDALQALRNRLLGMERQHTEALHAVEAQAETVLTPPDAAEPAPAAAPHADAPVEADEPKSLRGTAESMRRFVEPSFDVKPETLYSEKREERMATVQAQAESLRQRATDADAPAHDAPADAPQFGGSESFRRFVTPEFDAVRIHGATPDEPGQPAAADGPVLAAAPAEPAESPAAAPPEPLVAAPHDLAAHTESFERFVPLADTEAEGRLHFETGVPAPASVAQPQPQAFAEDLAADDAPPRPDRITSDSMQRFTDLELTTPHPDTPAAVAADEPDHAAAQAPVYLHAAPEAPTAEAAQQTQPAPANRTESFNRFVEPEFGRVRLSNAAQVPPPADGAPEVPESATPAPESAAPDTAPPELPSPNVQAADDASTEEVIQMRHGDADVEIVIRPDQLQFFREDPRQRFRSPEPTPDAPPEQAAPPEDQAAAASAVPAPDASADPRLEDAALRSLMGADTFDHLEESFRTVTAEPAGTLPAAEPEPMLAASAAEAPEVAEPDSAAEAPAPAEAEPQLPPLVLGQALDPDQEGLGTDPLGSAPVRDFAARISSFRDNLERIRNKTMPNPGEINLRTIQQKFLDQVVRDMSDAGRAAAGAAAPAAGYDIMLIEPQVPAETTADSNVDDALARFQQLEPAMQARLQQGRDDSTPAADTPAADAPEPGFNLEDAALTETLADIYRRQGNREKAAEIYRRLQLKHPEKSAYFAGLIAQLG